MFPRLRAWSARHPRLAGLLRLAPLITLCLVLVVPLARIPPGRVSYLVLTVVLIAPLFWRDRYPLAVFAAISLIGLAQWLFAAPVIPADIAVLIALWTVASRRSPRWAVAALLVCELGVFMALLNWRSATLGMFTTGSIFVVTVWLAGLYARTRRGYLEGLVERAERAERERDQRARLAATEERTRIARELHDVVAHGVSVMVVQADGARYALDENPEAARAAMATISATGRESLAEMRRMVGVLRAAGAPPGAPAGGEERDYLPQPGLAELADLVRGSGVPAELRVTGDPRGLPEGRQLAVYRIVQEALTNVLKHGGPQATAVVEVGLAGPEIVVRVTDDGRGAAAASPDTGGHGLTGMRERTGLYGGALTAAPRAGGGFEVLATLPAVAT